jgi:molybdopterin/thiamine biosynthesis adenylyltransferase
MLSETNLNRHIIAVPSQIGTPKVKVLSDYLVDRFQRIRVRCIQSHFPDSTILRVLRTEAIVVGCVDNEIARIQLDLSCRKYRRTLIDLGTGFAVHTIEGGSQIVTSAGGQVFLSRPTGVCLRCMGFDLSSTSTITIL